ncbi:Uncharacterised protein [Vibrio cholerae]|nr:Uncharacterised protein [Vibrio cholerae]CSI44909.1 Uncharacterised protein [Vibrio cholerae]
MAHRNVDDRNGDIGARFFGNGQVSRHTRNQNEHQ